MGIHQNVIAKQREAAENTRRGFTAEIGIRLENAAKSRPSGKQVLRFLDPSPVPGQVMATDVKFVGFCRVKSGDLCVILSNGAELLRPIEKAPVDCLALFLDTPDEALTSSPPTRTPLPF